MPFLNSNTLSKVGQQCTFATLPLYNANAVTTYSETLVGIVPVTKDVTREFRFTLDGIVFSEYYTLTNLNLTTIINPLISQKKILVIEMLYTRIGTDTSGTIVISSAGINTTSYSTDLEYPVASNTVFGEFIKPNVDHDIYDLVVNLSKKMYDLGIVPSFMTRNEENNNLTIDEDYIVFWQSIAHLFASMYEYAKKFTNVFSDKELLCNYLTQKTMQFCDCSELGDLQSFAMAFFDEIRQRGTIEIFRPKYYEYPLGYRNVYMLGITGVLSNYPIYIDGVRYTDAARLPFGWLYNQTTGALTSVDINYHLIEVPDSIPYTITADFDYNLIDDLPRTAIPIDSTLDPTHNTDVTRKYHGEYLRLICYSLTCDEFMFNLVNKQNMGWNIGNSSPLWKGLRQHQNNTIIKGYETFSEDVWDLSYYPIIGSGLTTNSFLIKHDGGATDLLQHNLTSPTNIKYI